MLSVLSVCSGAGGMDLGFHRAGFRTAGLCEWDEWRQQLLAARFPGVPVHPDLTEFADWCEQDPDAVREWCGGQPDVLIGGTPCQDLSVAGARAGLDGERSGLYFDYQRVRLALGIEWAVWENVAGALSSNDGLDFASVLGAFVGADVPVPAGGWSGAGVAAGPWGGCVYRLLDAQYFGVPQRRRRIFVVGRLGGACPPEVLLEPQGVRRDSQAGRGQGARVAASLTRGSSGRGVSEPGRRQEDDVNLVAGTVRSHPRPGSNDWGGIVNALDTQQGGPDDNSAQAGHLIAADVAGALTRRVGKGVDSDGLGMPLVAHTLRSGGFDASEDGTGRGTPLTVVEADGVRGEPAPRGAGERDGGEPEDGRREAGPGLPGGQGPDQHVLLDGEPLERQQRGHRPDAEGGERHGHPVTAGDAAGVDGAPADGDGVRTTDELAGRMDVASFDAFNQSESATAQTLGTRGPRASNHPLVAATGLVTTDRCAYDPQPDGRRYAACGDGVVANVAEWIAHRLASHGADRAA